MNAHDDDIADDTHPEMPPRLDVWLAEREVLMAAASLRDVSGGEGQRDGSRDARITYQAAWLRFMVSLCNLPLADRPNAVEHLIEALRVAHLLRQQGELDPPGGLIAPSARIEIPPRGP